MWQDRWSEQPSSQSQPKKKSEAAGWQDTSLEIIILVENMHVALELDWLSLPDCWSERCIEENQFSSFKPLFFI